MSICLNSDVMTYCADLIFADAVQDLALKTGRPLGEIRSAAISSPAYEALYDFETGLWQEGPDSFAALIEI